MAEMFAHQPLEAVMAEYMALFDASWEPKTKTHYRGAFKKLLE